MRHEEREQRITVFVKTKTVRDEDEETKTSGEENNHTPSLCVANDTKYK